MGAPVPTQCKPVLKGKTLRTCCSILVHWPGCTPHPSPHTCGKYWFKALPVKVASNVQSDSWAVSNGQCPVSCNFITILSQTSTATTHTGFEGLTGKAGGWGGGGESADLAEPLAEFKWNLTNDRMTSKHEGKPGGGGVSFTQFPSSLILPCSTDYSPMYPPLLQRLLPPGLIHPQLNKHPLLPTQPSLGFLNLGERGGRKGKEKEPGLGLPWLPKGFGQFKHEGSSSELGVVFLSWPNTWRQPFSRH